MYQSKWAPQSSAEEDKSSSPRATALSASAPHFSPAPPSLPQDKSAVETLIPNPPPNDAEPVLPAPPPATSSIETFAQTGAPQDDLFDDVQPIDDSMRVRSEDDLFNDDFTPVHEPVVEQLSLKPGRGRGDRPRGSGQAQRRVARGGIVPQQSTQQNRQHDSSEPQPLEAPLESAPTGPRKVTSASVRGDRQATGGVRKPKLTDEELAEKMAEIQIKNASLTAAHARAEADAASFAEREEHAKLQAAQRQKVERRDRQQMMGERERNRMRKLKGMEGREWDATKNENDFQRGGKFDKQGGFAGDKVDYNDGQEYLYREPRGGARGRGRGGRGGRAHEQLLPKREEFPALPTAAEISSLTATSQMMTPDLVKSWADQVESSNVDE